MTSHMIQPRLSTDKAREHNHFFRRERLHHSQRCTKTGANNKMFYANYPRDIQQVQGCLLCCTTELRWVYIPAQHIVIRQVLLSRAQMEHYSSLRKGEDTKNKRKKSVGNGKHLFSEPKLSLGVMATESLLMSALLYHEAEQQASRQIQSRRADPSWGVSTEELQSSHRCPASVPLRLQHTGRTHNLQ